MKKYCNTEDIRLDDIGNEQAKEQEKLLSALKNRLDSAKDRLVKMYKDKLDGIISDEDFSLFRNASPTRKRRFPHVSPRLNSISHVSGISEISRLSLKNIPILTNSTVPLPMNSLTALR